MPTPKEIYEQFKRVIDNQKAVEEDYQAAFRNFTPQQIKSQAKIDAANFHLKTLKEICGVK